MTRLCVDNISKRYPGNKNPALKDFSFNFENGVYGLLGPNGAGKSTLLNILVGILTPDTGSVSYKGQLIQKAGSFYRKDLGYMPQQQQLYSAFTVKRFLYYFAALKGLSSSEAKDRIKELLTLTGLLENADKRLSSLSGGMKQRVLLAEALLNDPEVLILDEPTAGLDPKERMNIRNYLFDISENKTIIIATHVISDVEQIARETIFLKNGETVLMGRPEEVIDHISYAIWEMEIPREELTKIQKKFPKNRVIGEKKGMVNVKIISEEKPELPGIHEAAVNLEDVYLYLYT